MDNQSFLNTLPMEHNQNSENIISGEKWGLRNRPVPGCELREHPLPYKPQRQKTSPLVAGEVKLSSDLFAVFLIGREKILSKK